MMRICKVKFTMNLQFTTTRKYVVKNYLFAVMI